MRWRNGMLSQILLLIHHLWVVSARGTGWKMLSLL
uniref:Uncharacterized protein n=1 Tax=Arundo donax TaxID=35708 RepID=A0A0A8YAK5_ARUDO